MDWLTCGPDWGVWLWAAAEMGSQSLQMTWCVWERTWAVLSCSFYEKKKVYKVYLNFSFLFYSCFFQQLANILTLLCSLVLSGCNRGFGSPHERCYQTYTDADTGGETSSLFLYPKLSVSFTQSLAWLLFFFFCLPHTCTHNCSILMETPKLDTLSVGEVIGY